MADAQIKIGQIRLAAAQGTVSFTNIPQTYKHLILVAKTANSGSSSAGRLQFNGDAGGNYNSVGIGGNGSGASSWSEANATAGRVIGYSIGPTTGWSTFTLNVMDYQATDKHKIALSRSSDSGSDIMATVTRYASLSPVTSLTIYDVLGQTYAIGSVFTLYGLVG